MRRGFALYIVLFHYASTHIQLCLLSNVFFWYCIFYGILYILYITKYGCVFLKLGESTYVAMDLIPILLGSLPLAHNAQHSLVIISNNWAYNRGPRCLYIYIQCHVFIYPWSGYQIPLRYSNLFYFDNGTHVASFPGIPPHAQRNTQ